MHWNDTTRELSIGPREGSFPGMSACQNYRVMSDETPDQTRTVRLAGNTPERVRHL
jgi:hypothetical protein